MLINYKVILNKCPGFQEPHLISIVQNFTENPFSAGLNCIAGQDSKPHCVLPDMDTELEKQADLLSKSMAEEARNDEDLLKAHPFLI